MVNIPQYRSSKSVAKNRTTPIAADDPRLSWDKIGQTKSILGSDIDYLGLDNKMLITGGIGINSSAGASISSGSTQPADPNVKGDLLPSLITNLTAEWNNDDIDLTFDFDTADIQNKDVYRFVVRLRDQTNNKYYFIRAGFGYEASTFLSNSSTAQTLTLLDSDIQKSGIELSQNIDQVGIATCSVLQTGAYVDASLAAYVSPFPAPIFTLSKGVDYYVVTMDPTNLTTALALNFYGIIIEEKITTETVKANVSLTTGWTQASPITTNAASVVYCPDGAHRWVRVKYVAKGGNNSVYSDIADITPDPFMPVNTDPPTNFNTASIEWQSNDIKVTFVRPSTNAGTVIKVKLVPYVNNIESTTFYGFYYKTLDALDTEFLIKSLDIYGQFGTYYSKFKAYITCLSAQGVESTSTISSGPVTRANPLASIYPTVGTPNVNSPTGVFRATPIANGYVVDFDLPVGATKLEVYEKATAWTVVPTNDDEMVYSGLSPATIITPNNDTRYVIVRYYDQFDNTSYYSMELTGQTAGVEVNPLDIGTLSLIENPIKIQTDGSIFAGVGDSTQYPQVFFNKDGIFAYDANGDWTTEIINSATSGAPTFITKRATIGDWTVAPSAIENTGYVSGSTYTGLSASGTYSFWAGSGTSKNSDASAKFSVTPAGAVTARKISIIGDGTSSDLINAGSGVFKVTNTGALTATSASITGSISVDGQSYFDANVNITNGYLIAGASGPGVGPNVQISSVGLQALNASSAATTKIYTSPKTVTNNMNSSPITGVTLWSSKALFGATESTGWLIADGIISSDWISLNSTAHEIKVVSQTSNSAKGVAISAGADNAYAIRAGDLTTPDFWVKHDGTFYAQAGTVEGVIRARDGGFGTISGGAVTKGWSINSAGITAVGDAEIDMTNGGVIKVGAYDIKSAGSDFSITNRSSSQTILTTDTTAGISRIFLGQEGRQVEVAKNAEISGAYSGSAQDYRSGGLRNMFTIDKTSFTSNSNPFASAESGSVLLVYTLP
jgi:hypothetical protein